MTMTFTVGEQQIEAAWHGPPPSEARRWCCCTRASAASRLWRDFPRALASAHRLRRARLFAAGLRPVEPGAAAVAADLHARRGDAGAAGRAGSGRHRDARSSSVTATAPRSRRSTPAASRISASRGVVLMAPHFFTEELGLRNIAAAKAAYEHGDLRDKLQRYHADVDATFYGWNGAWLDPGVRVMADRRSSRPYPGADPGDPGRAGPIRDAAQVEVAEETTYCPVETLVLPDCRHSPHLDQPEAALTAISGVCAACSCPRKRRPKMIPRESYSDMQYNCRYG